MDQGLTKRRELGEESWIKEYWKSSTRRRIMDQGLMMREELEEESWIKD